MRVVVAAVVGAIGLSGCVTASVGADRPPAPAAVVEQPSAVLSATDPICLPGTDPHVLDDAFRGGHLGALGALGGFDEPAIIDLGAGRAVWLVHDAYLDLDGDGGPYWERTYLHNLAIVVDRSDGRNTCVTSLYGGRDDGGEPTEFERGPVGVHRTMARWFWALAGAIDADGRLVVWWQEMVEDHSRDETRGVWDGIARHPVAVWQGVYDPITLARLEWRPAPDPHVGPMYGTAAVDDPAAGWTYLFGGALNRDLTLSGGHDAGPHPGTATFLARVPHGRYDAPLEYWAGDGVWTARRDDAIPIHRDGWVEWLMQPRLIDGLWVSVTKVDAWWQARWVVQTAPGPAGPWRVVRDDLYVGSLAEQQSGYTPVIDPTVSTAEQITVVMSQNGFDWHHVCAVADTVPLYWPQVFTVPVAGG